jgi:hypothetical protein
MSSVPVPGGNTGNTLEAARIKLRDGDCEIPPQSTATSKRLQREDAAGWAVPLPPGESSKQGYFLPLRSRWSRQVTRLIPVGERLSTNRLAGNPTGSVIRLGGKPECCPRPRRTGASVRKILRIAPAAHNGGFEGCRPHADLCEMRVPAKAKRCHYYTRMAFECVDLVCVSVSAAA